MKYTVKIETYKPKKANKTKSAIKRKYMSMIVNDSQRKENSSIKA